MEEKVGKPCECIYPFEKHYIDLLFSERIDHEGKKLSEVEEILAKMPPESRERYEGARDGYKYFINDLKIVRERFAAMPDCKGNGSVDSGKREQALNKLGPCKTLKVHDDGDLTVECKGKEYVVTTEGDIFARL